MNILLDECLDRRLTKELPKHNVKTVPQMGWASIKNGELLRRIAGQFEVFVTVDRNLMFQQSTDAMSEMGIIVLSAKSNRLADLKPLMPEDRRSIRDD